MNLADGPTLKQFLSRHGLWARKGLGQHFLVSSKVVSAICSAVSDCNGVLEIGPGPGVLTSVISESAERMIAVELDPGMIRALQESAPNADVRQADALAFDIDAVLQELPTPRGLVSNLPYYITGPLLTRIADARAGYSKAVLMMQREVADRVLAAAKTPARGSLSVYLQMQFEIKVLVQAPSGAFLPPPKVDSTVLELVPKPLPVAETEAGDLFRLVRLGFQQPRKTLVNNLVFGLKLDREAATEVLQRAGLSPTVRAQELSQDQWVTVHRLLVGG